MFLREILMAEIAKKLPRQLTRVQVGEAAGTIEYWNKWRIILWLRQYNRRITLPQGNNLDSERRGSLLVMSGMIYMDV